MGKRARTEQSVGKHAWYGVLEKVLQKHPSWKPGCFLVRSFKRSVQLGFQRCWTLATESSDSEFAYLFLVFLIHCFILEFGMKTNSMLKFPSVSVKYFSLKTHNVILW